MVINSFNGLANTLATIWKYDVLQKNLILKPLKFELCIAIVVLCLFVGKELFIQKPVYLKSINEKIAKNWVGCFCGLSILVVVFGTINIGLPYIYFIFLSWYNTAIFNRICA